MSDFDLNYIATRRKSLGLTVEDMAKKLGFANGSVYWKYERGIYKFNADILPALARTLKCNISRFYTSELAETEIKIQKEATV